MALPIQEGLHASGHLGLWLGTVPGRDQAVQLRPGVDVHAALNSCQPLERYCLRPLLWSVKQLVAASTRGWLNTWLEPCEGGNESGSSVWLL